MGTLAEKLRYLLGTKSAIKEAIVNKGVTVADTDTFRSYADKIGSISTGGSASVLQTKSVSITSNGTTTVTPDSGYDGMTSVGVTTNVQPTLQTKFVRVTSNGSQSVSPDSGYDGLSAVEVSTNVQPNLEDMTDTITENGEYAIAPSDGYDAIASLALTVNVAGASSAVKVATGTFMASSASSVTVTFDTELSATPDFIAFWESNNTTSYRSTSRTKMAYGGRAPLFSHSASSYYYQRAIYGSTSSSTSSFNSASYGITYSGTSTSSSSYPCIRAASTTGFKAYQRYYQSTGYALNGTYKYIAVCL